MSFSAGAVHLFEKLTKILKDKRGNALPIMAAATIPLIGIIGGAVDASRAYLVKTRLQEACDAGALAGRRTMTGDDLTPAARQQAQAFFDANLRSGAYGAEGVSFNVTQVDGSGPAIKAVQGTASARVPATLMRIFGYDRIPMSVKCNAELNIVNNDIMFLFDITGGMQGGWIEALRRSVTDFYSTLNSATQGSGSRLRVGFIPYSSNVNVGGLLQPIGAMRSGLYGYNSRQPSSSYRTIRIQNSSDTFSEARSSEAECRAWATNGGNDREVEGAPPGLVTVRTHIFVSYVGNSCTRTIQTVRDYYHPLWDHMRVNYDIDPLVRGETVSNPAWAPSSSIDPSSRWDGCIEERKVGQDDIHRVPDSQETRWAPVWPAVSFRQPTPSTGLLLSESDPFWSREIIVDNRPDYDCPKPALQLGEHSQGVVANYINTLDPSPVGASDALHEAAMIWGGRLMSTRGLFASNHGPAPNGKPVLRHMIIMMDGTFNPNDYSYNIYGIEELDHWLRDSSYSGVDGQAKLKNRFAIACAAAKADNVSVWVILFERSFIDPSNQHLIDCATPGQAFEAANPAELQQRFQYIASRLARLRLSN
ncbi:VWA domain-containing protein [Allosphingosinicella flava]|uniref:VWA domain-containing protein n=1 Tax=Allosphingosinicella flava TaxID=2771430 RepID=A0A7T2GJA8_9SPHN|nr:Tad domain-containing protein [Sphingosinicella flava]QPQ54889.1 VWA domain-containing protein [Sphingosinicella flava]